MNKNENEIVTSEILIQSDIKTDPDKIFKYFKKSKFFI